MASVFALRATTDKSSRNLSSGAHSRDPVAPSHDTGEKSAVHGRSSREKLCFSE
jgi:hypothetical protein